MSFRSKVKQNKPKVELHSITTLVSGSYKTGKTRLWKEISELHYDSPDDTLLMAFEDGYETWELENIVPLHAAGTDASLWEGTGFNFKNLVDSDDTLWLVWEYFKKVVVPSLVKEAKEGRITKLIGVDTADRAIDACTAWVIRDRSRKYGKTFASLQDISESKIENGWTALYDELKKPFDILKNVGYGMLYLAWTKEKETTLYDGKKYNSVQLMMSNSGKKVFESQSSLICCLYNETTVLDRSGNELEDNIKDKKGRERASNFHETKTMMYFRPSSYIEIAGGRYTNLPEKVEYGGEEFLKVFEMAVNGQLKKTTQTVEELKVEQEKERDEHATEVVEVLENDPSNLMSQIDDIVGTMGKEQKVATAAKFTEAFGNNNYKLLKGDAEKLKQALDIVKEVIA